MFKKFDNPSTKNTSSDITITFNELKKIYNPLFSQKMKVADIIQTYIDNTNNDSLFEELRLRYLSMYLFNSNLTNEKWSSDKIRLAISQTLDPTIVEQIVYSDNFTNDKLYSDVKSFLDEEIKSQNPIDIDELILNAVSHWGIEFIHQKIFIQILARIFSDYNLIVDITNYEDQILYFNNLKYWGQDSEDFIPCEVLILNKHIKIKLGIFEETINLSSQEVIQVTIKKPDESLDWYMITIDDLTLLVYNQNDKKRIYEHYNKINEKFAIEAAENLDRIKEFQTNIPNELIEISRNFINVYLSLGLIDRDNYLMFESLIADNVYTALNLDSSNEERNEIIDRISKEPDLYNNVNSHKVNYDKMLKISGRYINLSEVLHSGIMWPLIRSESIPIFSDKWETEYGRFFETPNAKTLNSYIDAYCKNLDIPTKNAICVGLFTYYLMNHNVFPDEINGNYLKCNTIVVNKIFERLEEIELELFENKLNNTKNKQSQVSISDVDLMDGFEFESFISLLFTNMGYNTVVTKGSGDQGIDVLAEKNGVKIGIQAKCYSNNVTNKAIQEVTAALKHYQCSKGIVVTNSYFTDSAVTLAKSNDIVLWDRDILKRKIEELF